MSRLPTNPVLQAALLSGLAGGVAGGVSGGLQAPPKERLRGAARGAAIGGISSAAAGALLAQVIKHAGVPTVKTAISPDRLNQAIWNRHEAIKAHPMPEVRDALNHNALEQTRRIAKSTGDMTDHAAERARAAGASLATSRATTRGALTQTMEHAVKQRSRFARLNQHARELAPLFYKAAQMPLTMKIAGTILRSDFERYEDAFKDDTVVALLPKCAEVRAALTKLASLGVKEPPTRAQLVKTAAASRQDVVQVVPTRYGYLLKWAAAPDGTQVQQQELSVPQAQQALPPEMLQAADEQGAATVTGVEAEPDPLVETPAPVEGFGLYKVQEAATGKEIVGFVIPTLFDPRSGTPTPMKLFVNGGQFAVQPDMSGVLVGISYNLPAGGAEPRGLGVFYKTDGRSIIATIPFNVMTSVSVNGSEYYSAQTPEGMEIQITPSDGTKRPVMVAPNQVAMPIDYTWLPLDNEIELAGSGTQMAPGMAPAPPGMGGPPAAPAEAGPVVEEAPAADPAAGGEAPPKKEPETKKQASVSSRADIRAWKDQGGGGGVVLSGPAFSKHGSGHYDWTDGVFWMAAAGCPQNLSLALFEKAASEQEVVQIYGLQQLRPEIDLPVDTASEKRAELVQKNIPKVCLLKEAMAIEMHKEARDLVGVDSLDSLLAIGLINQENVQDFVDGLPELEDTQSKLASLVLATQLGMQSVPKVAAVRAMNALEDVIRGLRALKTYQL